MAHDTSSNLTSDSQLDSPGLGALLGPRLRERRNELGKTLAALAREATLSTGYLSSIETGASVPSLPVLARIAHALEVSLAEILRSSSSTRLARGHITDTHSTSELAAAVSQLQIVRQCAKPGEAGRAPVELGNGDVFLYLYRGRLEAALDDGVFELRPGDALHCDRPSAITWRVLGTKRAIALWATARGGSRVSSAHSAKTAR
jgi:transcriptional regulator with XRE-family HTH domain